LIQNRESIAVDDATVRSGVRGPTQRLRSHVPKVPGPNASELISATLRQRAVG
jgi:hypothetical protein